MNQIYKCFKNSVEVNEENNNVFLTVNDPYMKQWIENKCLTIIKTYIDKTIQIEINETDDTKDATNLNYFNQKPVFNHLSSIRYLHLNDLLFGNNNRFAFAAAEAVAKRLLIHIILYLFAGQLESGKHTFCMRWQMKYQTKTLMSVWSHPKNLQTI